MSPKIIKELNSSLIWGKCSKINWVLSSWMYPIFPITDFLVTDIFAAPCIYLQEGQLLWTSLRLPQASLETPKGGEEGCCAVSAFLLPVTVPSQNVQTRSLQVFPSPAPTIHHHSHVRSRLGRCWRELPKPLAWRELNVINWKTGAKGKEHLSDSFPQKLKSYFRNMVHGGLYHKLIWMSQ